MELSEFVSRKLLEIEKGIRDARAKSDGPWIALGSVGDKTVWAPEKVTFDLVASVTSAGTGGISVMGFGKIDGSHETGTENRISFSVPVFFNSIAEKKEKT